MRLYSSVVERMEYIQKLFLGAAASVERITDWNEIIPILEHEPAEYRSVSYEGASFEIATKNLTTSKDLHQWKEFKSASRKHGFHVDIGLGWAFAKTGLSPNFYLELTNDLSAEMVLDGIGYYYGLYKGRATLKNKTLPEMIQEEDLSGVDQGLGRRLWYMAKGNVQEVVDLLQSFPASRHGDLFRGIGIACGYVGGNEKEQLQYLNEVSGEHRRQLQLGIILAAVSRILSSTVTPDIDLACRTICRKTVNELRVTMMSATNNFLYLYNNGETNHDWLTQLKSELLQTNS